jgi:cbb3-type cytochrome oxidase subunit 3
MNTQCLVNKLMLFQKRYFTDLADYRPTDYRLQSISIDKRKLILYTFLYMFKPLGKMLAQLPTTTFNTVSSNANVNLGFAIPSFDTVLSFGIRFLFIVAGLIALLYLLLGALAWITSGGNKESVDKAREKIQAALVGLILIFAVLAIVAVIENIFSLGLGLTRPIVFPKLIQ